MPRPLARVLRVLLWTAAVLIVLWATLIKGPMVLTRIRMQRLLADFHSIYPMQSTWSDGQRIMTRWQHWGYAKGPCTSDDCDYTIEISDPTWRRINQWWPEHLRGEAWSIVLKSLYALGWRDADFQLKFVVQDGKIVRTRTALDVDVVDDWHQPDNWDYILILRSQVRSRLKRSEDDPEHQHEGWILGGDEQLDDHPDYKIGRPGGCEGCESVEFTYTAALAHSEVVRLTNYDLSCLTRIRACKEISDLLPAGRDWHFYDGDHMGPKLSGGPGLIPCRAEPRALGRDAEVILEVEPTHTVQKVDTDWPGHPRPYEVTEVKVIRLLKGDLHGPSSEALLIEPFSGSDQDTPPELSEHLVPGHRAFVLLNESHGYQPDGHFEAPRCGVLEATPANLAALKAGMAQEITVRHPITY